MEPNLDRYRSPVTGRPSGIGASEIAILEGLSRYDTPATLWDRKVLGAYTEAGPAAAWGTLLEPFIIERYAEENRLILPWKRGAEQTQYRSPEHPIAICKPDVYGEVYCDGINLGTLNIQIKSVNEWAFRSWNNQLPDYHRSQVNYEGGILGCARNILVACPIPSDVQRMDPERFGVTDQFLRELVNSSKLAVFEHETDREYFARQAALAEEFWREHVIPRIRPLTVEDYRSAEKAETAMEYALESEASRYALDYLEHAERERTAKAAKEDLREHLMRVFANVKVATGPGWAASWNAKGALTIKSTPATRETNNGEITGTATGQTNAQAVGADCHVAGENQCPF